MSYIPMSVAVQVPAEARDVCPHCKTPLHFHRFAVTGVVLSTYHCPRHGDVVPMRSAVFTRYHHLESVL